MALCAVVDSRLVPRVSDSDLLLIRSTFAEASHRYISKDLGRLFHLKQFIWERQSTRDDPSSPPALVAFGSANFSTAALGAVYRLANGQPVLRGMANMECGVLMTGKVWLDLLEEGSKWEDGVTYVRPASRYASGSVPWNSPAWVKKK